MDTKDAFDMLHGNNCEKKSLSQCLDDMGFKRNSYMVIKRNGPSLKVGDTIDSHGNVQENKYLTFGGKGNDNSCRSAFNAIDNQMSDFAMRYNNGRCVNGMTGSNNGVYAAMAHGGDEFIITKDPEIVKQLERQLDFEKDQLGVPLSNGGLIVDYERRQEWENVGIRCKQVVVNRARGTEQQPKNLQSPFKDKSNNMDYTRQNLGGLSRL